MLLPRVRSGHRQRGVHRRHEPARLPARQAGADAGEQGRRRGARHLPRVLGQHQRRRLLGLLRHALPVVRAEAVPRAAPERRPVAALPAVPVRAAAAAASGDEHLLVRFCSATAHVRAGTRAAGEVGGAGCDGGRHPRVRAAACGRGRGRRGGGAGVRGVPRRGGEGGDGEAAAGVPARVPPAVHRRVAAGQLHLPGLPAQRLRHGGAAIAGSNGVVSEMLYAVLAFFCLCLFFFSFNKQHCI